MPNVSNFAESKSHKSFLRSFRRFALSGWQFREWQSQASLKNGCRDPSAATLCQNEHSTRGENIYGQLLYYLLLNFVKRMKITTFAVNREDFLHSLWKILKQASYFSLVCDYIRGIKSQRQFIMCIGSLKGKVLYKKAAENLAVLNFCINTHTHTQFSLHY